MQRPVRIQDRILDYFSRRGCQLPSIGLLQPADPLLDTAGEDLRRRIFITAGQNGEVFCLRPEFTIPVCLYHLGLESAGAKARYGYAGTVFRQRSDEPAEFRQAGIEDIGDDDRLAADVAAIADCCEAIRIAGVRNFNLVLGDQAIFEAVLASLGLPVAWQKRLGRSFGDMEHMADDLNRLTGANGRAGKLSPEIEELARSGNLARLSVLIGEWMDEAGLPRTVGRSPGEIALRFQEKAELAAARLDAEHRAALDAFLALEVSIADAPEALRRTASSHGLEIAGALETFANRIDALREAEFDVVNSVFRAGFGRRLDYYTGLVFEIQSAGLAKPVAGGGRYDRLMSLLGAPDTVPAVGFSIWLDRVAASGESA